MPYIDYIARQRIDEYGIHGVHSEGELNYFLTKMILAYLEGSPRYKDYNEVMGVLECVKQEFYRRKIIPYEKLKQAENGDVFEED